MYVTGRDDVLAVIESDTLVRYELRAAFDGVVVDSQAALYGVLALDAIGGFILYRVALDSAVQAAERLREPLIAALSAGDGPIAS